MGVDTGAVLWQHLVLLMADFGATGSMKLKRSCELSCRQQVVIFLGQDGSFCWRLGFCIVVTSGGIVAAGDGAIGVGVLFCRFL